MATAQDVLITSFKQKDDFSAPFKGMMNSVQEGFSIIANIGTRLAMVGTGVGAGLLGLGVAAVNAAADTEALKMGLKAVAGSAGEAEKQFSRLKDVAKLPGLGVNEAVQSSIALQSAGFSANLAERSIKAFGNALATVGKGREDLLGVVLALGQIASKGTISAEEINQIAERVPQIRTAMIAAFGTADTESLQKLGMSATDFVQKVVVELEKLPPITSGAKNAFSNLSDAWNQFLSALGTPLLPRVTKAVDDLSASLGVLETSGVLAKIGDKFAKAFGENAVSGILINGLSWVIATLEEIPSVITEVRNTFAQRFNEMRAAFIAFAGVLVNFATSTLIIKGLVSIVEAFVLVRKAIAAAAAAQAAMLVMTGVGVAAVLAGTVVAVGVMKALDGGIPRMGEDTKDSLPGRLGNIQRRQRKYRKMMEESLNADPTKPATTTDGTTAENKSPSPNDLRQTDYLQQIASNTSDRLKLDQRILGGGTLGADALNAVKVRQAARGELPKSLVGQAVALIEKAVREGMAGEIASLQRSQGYSPVTY